MVLVSDLIHVNRSAWPCSAARRAAAGFAALKPTVRPCRFRLRELWHVRAEPALLSCFRMVWGRGPPHEKHRGPESATRPPGRERGPTTGSSGSRRCPPTSIPSNADAAATETGNGALAGRARTFAAPIPHGAVSSLPQSGAGPLPLEAAVPSRRRAPAGRIRRSFPWPYSFRHAAKDSASGHRLPDRILAMPALLCSAALEERIKAHRMSGKSISLHDQ